MRMKRSDFLRILGLSAVSGAVIASDTFKAENKIEIYEKNTIGYYINQLPENHRSFIFEIHENKSVFMIKVEEFHYALIILHFSICGYWNESIANKKYNIHLYKLGHYYSELSYRKDYKNIKIPINDYI